MLGSHRPARVALHASVSEKDLLPHLSLSALSVPPCFLLFLLKSHLSGTMASLVDSKAEFTRRAKELLGDTFFPNIVAETIESFATLAFSVADQPNHIDDAKLDALAKKVFKTQTPTLGQSGALRRLAFEGLAFSLQDLKNRGDPEASSCKTLPSHEREHRRTDQVARLKGVLMEGELEPSHSLVDRAAAMLHDGIVRYIPPSSCTSRDAEVASVRRDKDFLAIENGEVSQSENFTNQIFSLIVFLIYQKRHVSGQLEKSNHSAIIECSRI